MGLPIAQKGYQVQVSYSDTKIDWNTAYIANPLYLDNALEKAKVYLKLLQGERPYWPGVKLARIIEVELKDLFKNTDDFSVIDAIVISNE